MIIQSYFFFSLLGYSVLKEYLLNSIIVVKIDLKIILLSSMNDKKYEYYITANNETYTSNILPPILQLEAFWFHHEALIKKYFHQYCNRIQAIYLWLVIIKKYSSQISIKELSVIWGYLLQYTLLWWFFFFFAEILWRYTDILIQWFLLMVK